MSPLLLVALLHVSPAAGPTLAANAGIIEVRTVPGGDRLGAYPYIGLSLAAPVGPVTLIPALALEWAPENGRDGLVGSLTADLGVHERLGLDVAVALIHDQPGFAVGDSAFSLGGSVGLSVFLGTWTVSPSVGLFWDLSSGARALVPGLNVAYAL